MSQSSSVKLESTWGKFPNIQAAQETQKKLIEAGIKAENITLETENLRSPKRIEDTEAISNLKTGAITGATFGALVGLFISLILTDFPRIGLVALNNFQEIDYILPVIGAIVGALGISLISGISGASVDKSTSKIENNSKNNNELKKYLLVVNATTNEVNLAREIINSQNGLLEEADRR